MDKKKQQICSRVLFHLFNFIYTIRYFFTPFFAIGFCLICMLALIIILLFPMLFLTKGSFAYDVLFALLTGVVASLLVSVTIEASNNFRKNTRRALELAEYFMTFYDFETNKGVRMQLDSFIHSELMERYRKSEEQETTDESDEAEETSREEGFIGPPLDDIQIVWHMLPKLMPVFQEVYEEEREFLLYKEAEALRNILSLYRQMKEILKSFVLMDVKGQYGDERDIEFLDNWLPQSLKENLSKDFLRSLGMLEVDQAMDKITNQIFFDPVILESALDDIPVGRDFLKEDENSDQNDMYEESCIMSMYCENILTEMEILEKEAMKQPVTGYLIRETKRKIKQDLKKTY